MEIPKRITLRVGEINTVRLPGLGTAGYAWTHEVIENSGLIEVSTGTGGSSQGNDRSGFQIMGASVDELIYIRALGAGRSRIRLIQRRPGVYQPSDKEHILEVDINN